MESFSEYAASMRLSLHYGAIPRLLPLSHNGLSWCNGYLSVAPNVVKTWLKDFFQSLIGLKVVLFCSSVLDKHSVLSSPMLLELN